MVCISIKARTLFHIQENSKRIAVTCPIPQIYNEALGSSRLVLHHLHQIGPVDTYYSGGAA